MFESPKDDDDDDDEEVSKGLESRPFVTWFGRVGHSNASEIDAKVLSVVSNTKGLT